MICWDQCILHIWRTDVDLRSWMWWSRWRTAWQDGWSSSSQHYTSVRHSITLDSHLIHLLLQHIDTLMSTNNGCEGVLSWEQHLVCKTVLPKCCCWLLRSYKMTYLGSAHIVLYGIVVHSWDTDCCCLDKVMFSVNFIKWNLTEIARLRQTHTTRRWPLDRVQLQLTPATQSS